MKDSYNMNFPILCIPKAKQSARNTRTWQNKKNPTTERLLEKIDLHLEKTTAHFVHHRLFISYTGYFFSSWDNHN
jgi:hypothetical protein